MKVFLDTNIFLEYFERRKQYKSVSHILSAIEDKRIDGVVSVGGVYTLAYILRVELKRLEIYRPEQTKRLRETLNTILSMVNVVGLSHKNAVAGTNDIAFDDIEDSFQYQSALQAKCDVLVTINIRDFSKADSSKIEILTPSAFASKYL